MSRTTKKAITVAQFITKAIRDSGKPQHAIARECGWNVPNIVTMVKQGRTRLPLDKVGPLAKSLEVDRVYLLWLAMHEYMPDTLEAVERVLGGTLLNPHEKELISAYRELTEGQDADIELHVGDALARVTLDGTVTVIKRVPKAGPTVALAAA